MSESNDLVLTGYEHKSQGTEFYIVFTISYNGRTSARRYSEFANLHKMLAGLFPVQMGTFTVRLPQKALFNRNPKFLEERRVLLENYLRRVVAVPEFRKSSVLRSFLQLREGSSSELLVTNLDAGSEVTSSSSATSTPVSSPQRPKTIAVDMASSVSPTRIPQSPLRTSSSSYVGNGGGGNANGSNGDSINWSSGGGLGGLDEDDIDSLVQQVRNAAVVKLPN